MKGVWRHTAVWWAVWWAYGVPAVWHQIQHTSQILYYTHVHVADLPDTHSHTTTTTRMQLEVGLGFIEAAAARSIGAFGGAIVP